jgi:hypothetical protein
VYVGIAVPTGLAMLHKPFTGQVLALTATYGAVRWSTTLSAPSADPLVVA